MAMATEEQTRQESANETGIADDRELYRAIGRIEGKQEMLVNSARSLEEQARENYRLLDAKIDGVKIDLDAKIDGVKTDMNARMDRLEQKFSRLTLGLIVGVVIIIAGGYIVRFLPPLM